MQAIFLTRCDSSIFSNQAGSAKGLKNISEWSDQIINHFWYCCETASKDTTSAEEALKKMKVDVDCKQVLQSSNLQIQVTCILAIPEITNQYKYSFSI